MAYQLLCWLKSTNKTKHVEALIGMINDYAEFKRVTCKDSLNATTLEDFVGKNKYYFGDIDWYPVYKELKRLKL